MLGRKEMSKSNKILAIIVAVVILGLLITSLVFFLPRSLSDIFESDEEILYIKMDITIDHTQEFRYTLVPQYYDEFIAIAKQSKYVPGLHFGPVKSTYCDMRDDEGKTPPTFYTDRYVHFLIVYENHQIYFSNNGCSIKYSGEDYDRTVIDFITMTNKSSDKLEQIFYK